MTKFVLACYGSRGDVEPCVVVGRELARRGHDVQLAVPPDLVEFAESAGLLTVPYGVDTRAWLDTYRNLWTSSFRAFWRVPDLIRSGRELRAMSDRCCAEMSATLTSLADGADLLLSGLGFEEIPANVAEHYNIPLVTLHFAPIRANGQLIPFLPPAWGRSMRTAYEWLAWRMNKRVEDTQRRELGLAKATAPASRRITERGSLEIQTYDEVSFPGLAAEWARWSGQRPFVGALTLELPTAADDEVLAWIAGGTPPVCFGFGSLPVASPLDTVVMIAAACTVLGERALLCAGGSDFSGAPRFNHVKIVDAVNYAAVFPRCRAVVHHGGAGTTAAGLRAGVPTVILSTDLDQTLRGAQIKRLKVGTARRLSATTRKSLVADLSRILAPDCVSRSRDIASHMATAAESATKTAELVEGFASSGSRG